MSRAALQDYQNRLAEAIRFIEEGDRFLVVSHLHPDGDAVSSTLAVGWILHKLGKAFSMVNEDGLPAKFGYLWGSSQFIRFSPDQSAGEFSRIIAVDCADFARIGEARACFGPDAALLNIDHHPTNDHFGRVNVVCPDAAATVEIVHDMAERMGIEIDADFATCIYTGLLTDTGGFRYSNTTPKVLRTAAKMLEAGAEGSRLAGLLLERTTFGQTMLLRLALNRMERSKNGKMAWTYVTVQDIADTNATPEDTEGLVNYPRNIEGVEVGILFKEMPDGEVKVSLRSNESADVSVIAKSMGGGGHAKAAGCTMSGALKDCMERMIREVEAALE